MSEEPQSLQFERARSRLKYVYQNSSFYRARLDEAGVIVEDVRTPSDFARVPLVSKTEIAEDQAANPPFGTLRVEHAGRLARIFCTGGTLLICLTAEDLAALERMFAEMFTVIGVHEGDLVDVASSFHWVVAGTVFDAAFRSLGAGVIPAGPGLSELRMNVLRHAGVTVLQAFTPYAEALGQRMAEFGDEPGSGHDVRLLIVGGELRARDAKKELENLWSGAAVRELYGTSEVGMTAADCVCANGMHLSPECFLEVVEPGSGLAVEPGSPGEVVMTELFRSAQPFIRYRSGDITEGLILEPCECGLATPRLGRIIGRQSDVLRVRGRFVSEALVRTSVDRFPQIGQWRVVVDRPNATDTLRLEVAATGGATVTVEQLEAVSQALKSTCALTFDVTSVAQGTITDERWYEDRRNLDGDPR
jgi:phenylacetate-CoA ligase